MNKFKWVWLEERNFGALVNTTWSKAKKIFSFLQVFFLLSWRKTPSLIPTLHFISMPFLKKKCDLRIEEKKVWTNETHIFCSNAYIENSGLKKEFDIKPVSLVGFVMNLELKTFFWLRKFTLKVGGLPRDKFTSLQKKCLIVQETVWSVSFVPFKARLFS